MKRKVTYNPKEIKRSTNSHPHTNDTLDRRLNQSGYKLKDVKIVEQGHYWKIIPQKK